MLKTQCPKLVQHCKIANLDLKNSDNREKKYLWMMIFGMSLKKCDIVFIINIQKFNLDLIYILNNGFYVDQSQYVLR